MIQKSNLYTGNAKAALQLIKAAERRLKKANEHISKDNAEEISGILLDCGLELYKVQTEIKLKYKI